MPAIGMIYIDKNAMPLKPCSYCNIKIEEQLDICPNCGQGQPPVVKAKVKTGKQRFLPRNIPLPRPAQPPPKLILWRVIAFFSAFIALVIAGGCFVSFVAHKMPATAALERAQDAQTDNRPAGTAYLQSFSAVEDKYGKSSNRYAGSQVQGGQRYDYTKIEGIMRLVVEADGDHVEYVEYDLNHKWTQEQLLAALNANGTRWQRQGADSISGGVAASLLHNSTFRSQEGHVALFNDVSCQLQITAEELTQLRAVQKEQQQRKNAEMPRF